MASTFASPRSILEQAPPSQGYGETSNPMTSFTEVPWNRAAANAVTMIGRIGTEFEVRVLDNGNTVVRGTLVLKQKNGKSEW